MPEWFEGLKRMWGAPQKHAASSPSIDAEQDEKLVLAKRRLDALDVRVDVLTRRLKSHEAKPH